MTGYIELYFKGELIDCRIVSSDAITEKEVMLIWKYRYGKKFYSPLVKIVTDYKKKLKFEIVKRPCNRNGVFREKRDNILSLLEKSLSVAEISKITGVNENTVRSIKWRYFKKVA